MAKMKKSPATLVPKKRKARAKVQRECGSSYHEAHAAVLRMQRDARAAGIDRWSIHEINAFIAKARRERGR